MQVWLESADVYLDSDGCVATIEPVPTVRPVEWRGERARRLALLAFDPVAGVFILGRIDAFAVHVHGYGGVGGPMEHEGVSLVHVRLDFGTFTRRSEEHTSELQSLMRISYAVFCLKKKKISPN